MTLARRIAVIVDCDGEGAVASPYTRGGMDIAYAESVASFHVQDGADEVWLRLTHPGPRGVAGLFERMNALSQRVFVPVVAWGPVDGPSDARLLLSFGADRVVVELGHVAHGDPVDHIEKISAAIGKDRVSAALVVRRVASEKGLVWELCDEQGQGTGRNAVALARALPHHGAGEIVLRALFPGIDPQEGVVHDGDLIEEVSSWLDVPVVSVGDDRRPADMAEALLMGADAVASPTLFRDGSTTVAAVKRALKELGVTLRPPRPPYEVD